MSVYLVPNLKSHFCWDCFYNRILHSKGAKRYISPEYIYVRHIFIFFFVFQEILSAYLVPNLKSRNRGTALKVQNPLLGCKMMLGNIFYMQGLYFIIQLFSLVLGVFSIQNICPQGVFFSLEIPRQGVFFPPFGPLGRLFFLLLVFLSFYVRKLPHFVRSQDTLRQLVGSVRQLDS